MIIDEMYKNIIGIHNTDFNRLSLTAFFYLVISLKSKKLVVILVKCITRENAV